MYQYKEKYILDFRDVKYYFEFHAVIKKGLDLPDYYGCNFDALWDCLTDIVGRPLNIEIIGIENIERRFGNKAELLLDIFDELKAYLGGKYADSITVNVIRENR